jgi:hypothetical protein
MSRSDSQQSKCRPLGRAPALLPIPERMNADAHGPSETSLGQANETPEGCDVGTRFEAPLHEAFANTRRNGASNLPWGQLGDASHFSLLMWL